VSKFILNQPSQKSKITQQLVELLPDGEVCDYNQAMSTWWYNIRKSGGLRLTDIGLRIFKDILEFDTWSADISTNKQRVNQRILLQLDRNLDWPYYVDRKKQKIHFFSSREATLATLYGDVHEWLSKTS